MSSGPALTENDIYERMVASILDHRLPPGTKLIEDRLAAAFGVSRTRIRPVLHRLANERIATLTPNRGATVTLPSEAEAREVFEVRRLIEPTLIGCFIDRATPLDIEFLSRCITDEEAARAIGDVRRAVRLAGDFHLHIAGASGHQTLGRILREMVSRTSLVLMTYGARHVQATASGPTCGCQGHRALMNTIRLRDAREAARQVKMHLVQLEAQLVFALPVKDVPDLMALFAVADAIATHPESA